MSFEDTPENTNFGFTEETRYHPSLYGLRSFIIDMSLELPQTAKLADGSRVSRILPDGEYGATFTFIFHGDSKRLAPSKRAIATMIFKDEEDHKEQYTVKTGSQDVVVTETDILGNKIARYPLTNDDNDCAAEVLESALNHFL